MSDNTFATARNIGVLAGTRRLRNSVGKRDKIDFYKFTLPARSSLSLSLKRLSANAGISLFNAQNRSSALAKSNRPGKKAEQITRTLDAGTYYIKVNTVNNRNTRYTLLSSATPTPVPPPVPTPVPTPAPTPTLPSVSYYYGYGLVDAAAAVASAIGQAPFPDFPFQDVAANDPSRPNASYLWGLDKIKAPESWVKGYTGQGVTIAVVDTGVDYFNPTLKNNIWNNQDEIASNGIDDDRNGFIDDTRGWDFLLNDNTPLDVSIDSHGTFIAGILAAQNIAVSGVPALSGRTLGVAPNAKIMPVKVYDEFDIASDLQVRARIANGIYYAVNNGADIINLSLGYDTGTSETSFPDPQIETALRFARQRGVVIVAAAGNQRNIGAIRPGEPAFAAVRDLGIAVGAIDRTGKLADFSNPAGNQTLDYVAAPGVDIFSTEYDNATSQYSYRWADGTSFAAPYVAGVAALMLSANPNLTPSQIETILTTTANFGGVTAV